MKATTHLRFLMLVLLAFVAASDCGGTTTEGARADADAGAGADAGPNADAGVGVGVGPNADAGLSVDAGPPLDAGLEAAVVPTRVPASHRAVASSCVGVNSPPEPVSVPEFSSCTQHADCTAGVNGKCVTSGIGTGPWTYYCAYDQCATDADCALGMVCYCSQTTSARCLYIGNCQIDADCGNSGYGYCSPSASWECSVSPYVDGYHCHTAADTCLDDSDCTAPNYCTFDEYTGAWHCMTPGSLCAIG
jgi:hypothetical protein